MDYGFLNILLNVTSLVVLAGGVFAYSRSKIPSNTIQLYQDNQLAQTARLDSMNEELREAKAGIVLLQEEVRVIKTLPLDSIATTLSKLMETQNAILKAQNLILDHIKLTPTASAVTINAPGATTSTTS